MMIQRLAIIGVGLMGGSLALALRQAKQVREIVGYGRGLGNLQDAVARGVIDRVVTSLDAAVRDADMVILSTPVGVMGEALGALATHLPASAVITDVGSVKSTVIHSARVALGDKFKNFVPAHPMAGSEKSGAQAAQTDLYRHQRVILTPVAETDPEAIEKVRAMWIAVGAQVSHLDPDQHDAILALTSHLPHLMAFGLMDLLTQHAQEQDVLQWIGNGLRDMTRIAASDPVMWRDICLTNRDAVLAALSQYREELDTLTAAIERGDGAWLKDLFARAKQQRDSLR